jgi:hypothetical protein
MASAVITCNFMMNAINGDGYERRSFPAAATQQPVVSAAPLAALPLQFNLGSISTSMLAQL